MAQHTLFDIEYTGYTTVRVFSDGSYISPADAARTEREDGEEGIVAKWDGECYSAFMNEEEG